MYGRGQRKKMVTFDDKQSIIMPRLKRIKNKHEHVIQITRDLWWMGRCGKEISELGTNLTMSKVYI